MWKRALVVCLVVAGCSSGTSATTEPSVTVASTTTTTIPPSTTSSSTTSSSTSTTTTTIPAGFTIFTHDNFAALIADNWVPNPDFPGAGAGFQEDHTALALPPTSLDISFEEQEAGFDLDAHIERLKSDLAAFVPDFRVLHSGEEEIDGARSLWFEYAEEFDGFPIVIREQVALNGTMLVTLTLISPVEFFEFDATLLRQTVESFRFA